MSRKQVVDELHKSTRKNFIRRKVITKGIDDLWQCDLVEMIPYAKENNNYKYLLTVIDVFSKYAWVEPVKSKSGLDVKEAFLKILKLGRIPKNLQTDNGKEFYNSKLHDVINKYSINHYSTYSTMKASVVERFNRTFKSLMWKGFSLNGNYNWIKYLKHLIYTYNHTKHRTINMRPVDVNRTNEKELLKSVYNNLKIAGYGKFKLGDYVRISKNKGIFDKSYTPNWSTEIFTIDKIQITNPITYLLKDFYGNPIKGGFYEQELQKTKNSDIYLVEKVLKQKGSKVFVKWLGFDNTHNSWINKKDVV